MSFAFRKNGRSNQAWSICQWTLKKQQIIYKSFTKRVDNVYLQVQIITNI